MNNKYNMYNITNERRRKLYEAILTNISHNEDLLTNDFRQLEHILLNVPNCIIENCLYYIDYYSDGFANILNEIIRSYLTKSDAPPIMANLRKKEHNTIGRYVWNVIAAARDSNELSQFDSILDYILVNPYDGKFAPENKKTVISCDEFDDVFEIMRGCSEGLYISWYLQGRIKQEQSADELCNIKIATIKTLETNFSAHKIMGKVTGILKYFAQEYRRNM